MSRAIKQAVARLYDSFEHYQLAPNGPAIRRNTMRLVADYVDFVVCQAIGRRRFYPARQHHQHCGGLDICVDRMILDADMREAIHIEEKSYLDVDMAKRFVFDSHCLVGSHPDLTNVSLSMQLATTTECIQAAASQLPRLRYGENLLVLSVVDELRSSKTNRTYLFDYEPTYIEERTEQIVSTIRELLP